MDLLILAMTQDTNIIEHVFKTLDNYLCEQTLVSQTYDSGVIMLGGKDKGGLQSIVKASHKHLHFIMSTNESDFENFS